MESHDHLVTTMQKAMWCVGGFQLEWEWGETRQSGRRQFRPSHRDRMEDRRDPLPFRGDGEPDAKGTRPPLAWTVIWQGTYSNMYGEYIPKDTIRWGYILWDAVRIEVTGARQLLEAQWEDEWAPLDPRELP